MKRVHVYHDGKLGRAQRARIVKEKGNRKLITFIPIAENVAVTQWFTKKRRENGGAWCCEDYNHWYYPERETENFALLMEGDLMYDYWFRVFYPKIKTNKI